MNEPTPATVSSCMMILGSARDSVLKTAEVLEPLAETIADSGSAELATSTAWRLSGIEDDYAAMATHLGEVLVAEGLRREGEVEWPSCAPRFSSTEELIDALREYLFALAERLDEVRKSLGEEIIDELAGRAPLLDDEDFDQLLEPRR